MDMEGRDIKINIIIKKVQLHVVGTEVTQVGWGA